MIGLRYSKILLRPNIFKLVSINYVTQHPIKFTESQRRWQIKDSVTQRWELIYKAPMESLLNYLSVYLSFSTVTIACAGIYSAFTLNISDLNNPVVIGEDVVIANSGIEYIVYLSAFIFFHVSVKVVLSKYVIRLYQDGDNYLAVFRGHFYNSIKKHEFNIRDFSKLKPTFVISWSDARYSLGKKHGILLENYFKTPEYLNHLIQKKSVVKSENKEM